MNLFASVLMGFGQGYQPVVGYNWGAGKYERVSKAFWFAVKFGIVCMAVVGLPMILFAEQFMRIFSATDPEVIRIGSFAIRLQAIALPIGAIVVVINMTYTALGRALGATVLGLARQGICFLPSVLILPAAFGVMGLAAAQATADFLSIAIGIPLGLRILKEIKAKMKSVLPES
jgi:Na+-driven multidrug efflux pump